MASLYGPLLSYYALAIVRSLLYPSYVTFNWLACLYVTTCIEDRNPSQVLLKKILLTPVYGSLFFLCLPLLIIFLPIRCLLVSHRQPFLYSEKLTEFTKRQAKILNESIRRRHHRFGIASCNLCLMPVVASKMNNFTSVDDRAKQIGDRIIKSQFFNDYWTKLELWFRTLFDSDGKESHQIFKDDFLNEQKKPTDLLGDVTISFPNLDFLLIQEAWSSYHNKGLIQRLHKSFPYIVHDVGVHSFKNNNFFLNSGLLLASKHPIVAVCFKPYNSSNKHGKVLSLGLLMVKVTVGRSKANSRHVGYIFNTHLQSYQGKDAIIIKQLDELLEWAEEFVQANTEEGDKVLFNFVCGDFNFDNLSPADTEVTRHRLFDEYTDVCRLRPGYDKHWTVGTELRQDHLFDSLVTTPDGLKHALEDPVLRQCHVNDGDVEEHTMEALTSGRIKMDKDNNVIVFPEGGRRRIDYIIYNKSSPVNVEGFHFVTQLASLTDHIPVAMEFTCPALD